MDGKDILDMWPYWLAGIGTLSLAAITFYIEVIKPRITRPRFAIAYDNVEPYCRQTTISTEQSQEALPQYTDAYWIRLRVINSGRSVARRCIGKLVRVSDQLGQEFANFDPVALHWVGTDPNKVPLNPIDLNKGEYEYLDVIYTRGDIPDQAFICSDAIPRGIPRSLPPGEYILRVTIYGDNVNPLTKFYRLIWSASNILDIQLQEIPTVIPVYIHRVWQNIRSMRYPIRIVFRHRDTIDE